jgi:hypothetical protein
MTPEELKSLADQFGKQAADEIKRQVEDAEKRLNDKWEGVVKGSVKQQDFDDFKKSAFEDVNKSIEKLTTVTKAQGDKINERLDKAAPNSISIEQFIESKADKIKELRDAGRGYMEFSGAQLKAAGVNTIGSGIQDVVGGAPGNPYIPGIASDTLTLFDIVRNPNFITNKVDLGRTDRSILAWANETDYVGAPAFVAEGGLKPMTQHKFNAAISKAKKIAALIEITEEFDDDLPGFGTQVRRMLQQDVIRAWDDAIQNEIILASTPYSIHDLDSDVFEANRWDALLAMLAQVRYYNFIPNAIAINPFTNVALKTAKNANGTYLLPTFAEEINGMLTQANKVASKYALAGDLTQFKVDIYKDFYTKIGWINDDFAHNQFAVAGEIRYHSYISDNRKKALVYNNINAVAAQISGTPGS